MTDLLPYVPVALCLWLCVSLPLEAMDLYVAPEGNDAWSGRLPTPNAARTDGPATTLQAARDAARKLDPQQP